MQNIPTEEVPVPVLIFVQFLQYQKQTISFHNICQVRFSVFCNDVTMKISLKLELPSRT